MEEIKREKGAQAYRQQLVSMVNTRFDHSQNTFSTAHRRFSRYYDLYRQISQTKFHPFRNNVSVPIPFQICQAAVAAKASMMLGGGPPIMFYGGGPEDQAVARKQETLVNRQMEDCNTYVKGVKFLTGAEVYGTQFYRWFWRTEEGKTSFRVDKGHGEELVQENVLKFNGPDWEPVDILDCFPAPGYPSIEQMPWFIWRYWMDLEDVHRMAEIGYFEKAGVSDLTWSPPSGDAEVAFRRNIATGQVTAYAEMRGDKFSRPVEMLEMWGRTPRALVDDEEFCRVVTVANRTALMRSDANPHSDRSIPFGAHSPTPDPHYLHSPGKVEVIAKLAYSSNRIANHKLDALDLNMDPMWLASKRSGFDPRNLRTRPGGVVWADREVGPDMIQPLRPDLSGVQNAYVELEQQAQWMQKATGIIDDTVQGMSAANRTTAREFQGRQEAASRRIMAEVRLAEQQWLVPLAKQFVRMNRQWLPFPQQVQMLGVSSVLDPITLRPIEPPGPVTLTVNDMLPDYDVRAVGATRAIGTAARQQNMVMLLQAIQANPMAAASVNWLAFFRQLFKTFEIENVDELLNTDPLIQMAMMQLGQMVQGGGQPGSGKKPAGNDASGQPAMIDMMSMMGGGQVGS